MTLLLFDIVEISFSSSWLRFPFGTEGYGYGIWRLFQPDFSCIAAVCFIGAGIRRTRRKLPTCRKLQKTLSHIVVSNTHRHERDSNSQFAWWSARITQLVYIQLPYDHDQEGPFGTEDQYGFPSYSRRYTYSV